MTESDAAALPAIARTVCGNHVWVETSGGWLSRCEACGLVATTRVPRFDYAREYFVAAGRGGYDFDAAYALDADAVRFGAELTRLEASVGVGTLLDVGCATGTFLAAAAARGWTVSGVEVSEYARVTAAERSGAKVVASCADLEPDRTYDVVTLHHVLEHVHDPVALLRDEVAPRVGRRLLIEVPNFQSLDARVHGGRWKDLRLEQHVFHYSASTLRAVVEAAGLRVERTYSLWEPLWSLRATLDLGYLLFWGALGRDHRWDAAVESDMARTREALARYRRPNGLRRVATAVSRMATRPMVAALEAAGLGTRLVVEAVPRDRR